MPAGDSEMARGQRHCRFLSGWRAGNRPFDGHADQHRSGTGRGSTGQREGRRARELVSREGRSSPFGVVVMGAGNRHIPDECAMIRDIPESCGSEALT
jgi:hypothetical protein